MERCNSSEDFSLEDFRRKRELTYTRLQLKSAQSKLRSAKSENDETLIELYQQIVDELLRRLEQLQF